MRRTLPLLLWGCLSSLGQSQPLPEVGFTPIDIPPPTSVFYLPPTSINREFVLAFRAPNGTLKERMEGIGLRQYNPTQPGLLDRIYQRALRDGQDAALFSWPVDTMSGGGHFDSRHNQRMLNLNTSQMTSILQNAVTQSVLQEVMGSPDNSIFSRPVPNSTADFQRRMQGGTDVSVGLNPSGVSARLNWRLFGLQLSSGVSTQTGGLDPLQLSLPFLKNDTRGEFSVNSRGEAWMFMMSRW